MMAGYGPHEAVVLPHAGEDGHDAVLQQAAHHAVRHHRVLGVLKVGVHPRAVEQVRQAVDPLHRHAEHLRLLPRVGLLKHAA